MVGTRFFPECGIKTTGLKVQENTKCLVEDSSLTIRPKKKKLCFQLPDRPLFLALALIFFTADSAIVILTMVTMGFDNKKTTTKKPIILRRATGKLTVK
jgi:hypothetical protein